MNPYEIAQPWIGLTPGLSDWSTEDLDILASLFVNAMISIAEAIEDAQNPTALDEIKRSAIKQLRMIAVSVADWHSQTEQSQ